MWTAAFASINGRGTGANIVGATACVCMVEIWADARISWAAAFTSMYELHDADIGSVRVGVISQLQKGRGELQ